MLDRISSYNLITSLIPGLLLVEALRACDIPLVGGDKITSWLVLGYALGSVSARIGSLLIEPGLKRLSKRRKNSYAEFINASSADSKLDVLTESANGYRTIIATCIVFFAILVATGFLNRMGIGRHGAVYLSVGAVCLIFIAAYLKQEAYISRRIGHNNGDN